MVTISLYLSYPRLDNYYNSRGYSTGELDIDAVRWINNQTEESYIVLANQQVSAAALHELGFKHYYKNEKGEEIYNYPIPTGGKLYQYYLDMVYKKPSRQTVLAAMKLAGAEEGYFVLNKYWWAYAKVLAEAKLEADEWKEFGEGEIMVFKYKKRRDGS